MSESNNSVTVRVPVTMKIAPVPDEVKGSAAYFTFGLANVQRIFDEKGIVARVDGQQAQATFGLNGEVAKTQTSLGVTLDDRAFRIQPAAGAQNGHQLEISNDLGETFEIAGTFVDYDFARAVGDAWVDGRVENLA